VAVVERVAGTATKSPILPVTVIGSATRRPVP